ncbi:MAG: protein kinase [Verrucomicrobiales bacterium]|nr:protein kinase [Verrucomicrobiales bacterium]
MTASHPCPSCGASLSPEAPEGLCPRCLLTTALGQIAPEASSLPSPTPNPNHPTTPQFGDYEVVECIPSGGMGVVYKARHRRLGRWAAIKALPFGRFTRQSYVQRFQAEAEVVSRLRHPNIVAIHEVGEQDGQSWFAMDFIEGPTLAEVLRGELVPLSRTVRLNNAGGPDGNSPPAMPSRQDRPQTPWSQPRCEEYSANVGGGVLPRARSAIVPGIRRPSYLQSSLGSPDPEARRFKATWRT